MRNLLVLLHFDWFGPAEELKQRDEAIKKACVETDGIENKRRYTTNQRKTHCTYLITAENFDKYGEVSDKIFKLPRDYKKLPYGTIEFYPVPFRE